MSLPYFDSPEIFQNYFYSLGHSKIFFDTKHFQIESNKTCSPRSNKGMSTDIKL